MANSVLQKKRVLDNYGTDISLTFDNPCTPGSTIVVIANNSSVTYVTGIDDDGPNGSYTEDIKLPPLFAQASIWSHPNTKSSALTVTMHLSGTSYWSFELYELSGPPSSGYISASGSDDSTAIQAITLVIPDDHTTVFVVSAGYPGGTYGTDSGMTVDWDFEGYGNVERSDDIGVAGSYSFNNGGTSPNNYQNGGIIAIAYKTSGGGGGGTTYNVTQDASLKNMNAAKSVAAAVARSSSMLPFSSATSRRAGKVSTGSTSLPSVTMTRSTGKISPASMSVMITLLPRSISKQMASAASLLAATVSKQTTRTFSASALPFASTLSTLKVFLITLLASMSTFAVSQSRSVSKSLSTSLNLSPVLTRATSKINQASITVQASLGTLKVILRTLAASMLTFTATRTTSIRKVHATSLNFSASTAKSVIITLAAGLTFAAQRAISRAKTFSATLGMTAALVMDYTRTSLWGFKRAKAKKTTMTPTRKDMNNE